MHQGYPAGGDLMRRALPLAEEVEGYFLKTGHQDRCPSSFCIYPWQAILYQYVSESVMTMQCVKRYFSS
jgi:hypothetical protein